MRASFDAAAHVDHMAKVMELEIRPEWRDAVVATMAATAAVAALVLAFPLDDHVEPAPVFEP
jgi:anti-sigma-K factor RskA